MNQNNQRTIARMDIYFMLLIALTYALNCFFYFLSSNDFAQFVVLFNILYLLVIVSYFTSMLSSLIFCLVYVLGFGTYILYQVVAVKQTVSMVSYIWLIVTPLCCIAISFYRSHLMEIQENIIELDKKGKEIVGFDETTGHLNEHMFHYDMERFMSMARRGYIKLTLLVIRLKYYHDILRIIGQGGINELYIEMGRDIDRATRSEDIPYFTKDGKFMLVAITDMKGAAIVKERIRNEINLLYMQDHLKTFNVSIDVQIGIAEYDDTIGSAFDLQKKAEQDMEFDV